jgi:hypothetical protein
MKNEITSVVMDSMMNTQCKQLQKINMKQNANLEAALDELNRPRFSSLKK